MKALRLAFATAVLCGTAFAAYAALPDYITKALADPHRPATEASRDVNRKPGELIEFAGIKPGMTVVDMLPGIGAAAYYTRIFSGVVGPTGKVYAFYGIQYDERLKTRMNLDPEKQGDQFKADYANVTALHMPLQDFKTPEQVDLIWTSNNLHDTHNKAYATDVKKMLEGIYAALKPGGIFMVVDHRAAKGAGLAVTETLHRMDEDVAKQEVQAVGFRLIGESDILANKDDDNNKRVFEEGEHDHTDIMVLKFQKPAR